MTRRSDYHFSCRTFFFIFTILALTWHSAHADWQYNKSGWYDVTNYEGYIGKYPIHLSLQKYEFGSGLNIEGSYYYDNHMSPIPLYGTLDKNGNMSLCESHYYSESESIFVYSKSPINTSNCQFHLKVVNRSANGRWVSGMKRYEVALNETAHFDNLQTDSTLNGELEIPFWAQTPEHMFIGAYEFKGDKVRTTIKIVNKRTRKVVQIIQPDEYDDCSFGFFITDIYGNVEYGKPSKIEGLDLNCESRLISGQYISFRLNKSSGQFEPYDYNTGFIQP